MKLWKHMKEVHGMKLVIELVVELVMVLVLHRYGARRRRRLPMSSPLAGAGMAEILLFTPRIRVSRASLAMPGARELFEWTEDERERERQSPIYIYILECHVPIFGNSCNSATCFCCDKNFWSLMFPVELHRTTPTTLIDR